MPGKGSWQSELISAGAKGLTMDMCRSLLRIKAKGRLPRRSARHREERSGLPVGTAQALCAIPVVGWVERHRVVIM